MSKGSFLCISTEAMPIAWQDKFADGSKTTHNLTMLELQDYVQQGLFFHFQSTPSTSLMDDNIAVVVIITTPIPTLHPVLYQDMQATPFINTANGNITSNKNNAT
jgi:hypothetical protein